MLYDRTIILRAEKRTVEEAVNLGGTENEYKYDRLQDDCG